MTIVSKDIEKILQQSDKAELLEWVQTHLPGAEKCFIAVAKSDGEGGLVMYTCQIGCKYQYELVGFLDWMLRFVEARSMVVGSAGDDDADDNDEDEE